MTESATHTDEPAITSHLPSSSRRIPVSTYRLQLGPDFGFDKAQQSLDYLDDLGVTDVYLSPILQAAPGSTHGYDVVDHTHISAELGGREGFERFAHAAHERSMGVIVDVVPNHMGVPTPIYHNKALWSVLKDGPHSPYAHWFDGTDADGDGILMPFLGERIGTVLANQEITRDERIIPGMEESGPQPVLIYYDHVFPVRAGTEQLPLPLCIAEQYYRLAYWKVAAEELNFRRFFDVDTLLAVRVEDPDVFESTHRLLFDLYREGFIDGFRIDHPDGLADPREYMRRLSRATAGAWIVAEKICEDDEMLPNDWPVAGTTGYDTSWRLSALHCDQNGISDCAGISHAIAGDIPGSYPDLIADSKREITKTSLIAEVHRISTLAYQIASEDIMLRDHTQGWIAQCLIEMIVAFPRYRGYLVPGEAPSAELIELVEKTAQNARRRLDPDLHDTLDLVVDLILGHDVGSQQHAQQAMRDELVVRFQQVCGAVQAKGVEDTAFYRWTHLIGLNEVGGSPTTWGYSADDFHAWCSHMSKLWPVTMTCGTTHDNKRSEDVRERIDVISQYATEWKAILTGLHELIPAVNGHAENMLWQVLAGTWTDSGPIEIDRLKQYMKKASREQKLWTSWTNPDEDAERALDEAIDTIYRTPAIVDTLSDWYHTTRDAARTAILSRKALQLTCLGVADTYQSCETLQNYLVDPDNRQPVDFNALASMLARIDRNEPTDLAEEKLHITRQILNLRRRRPDVFVGAQARYQPLPSSSGHVVSYARGRHDDVVVVASRLQRTLERTMNAAFHSVVLPEGTWVDVLTDRRFDGGATDIKALLASFPCAVLERISGEVTTSIHAVGDRAPHAPAEHHADGLLGWLTRRFFNDGHTTPGQE